MLIVCYDFTSDKRRARFSKLLKKYGHRIQYSVYSINNSKRVLSLILTEIEANYKNYFDKTDHILIFSICNACKKNVIRYGNASLEFESVVYLG